MSLSIWYVSKYISPPGRGSAGVRGYSLMKELSGLGHKVSIIASDSNHLISAPTLKQPYLVQKIDGLCIYWVRTLKYFSARSLRRVLSWLHFEWRLLLLPKSRLSPPNVVIVSSLSLLTILNGLIIRLVYNCVLIFEVRDIWPLTLTEEGGFNRFDPFIVLLGFVEYLAYRMSDAIVGTMPNLGAHVESVLGFRKEVYCVPMGVDKSPLASSIDIPRDYVDAYFPPDKFIVAHVGSIGTTNALDTFFECARSMACYPGVHFLVIGDGDLREEYQHKYDHLDNLTFAPKIPKDMVHSALSLCDLLYFSVYKSKVWDFGQSLNKVVDYMLAGKPIVASYSGFPSMIDEARCGSFVSAGSVVDLKNELLRFACMSESKRHAIGLRGTSWLLENRGYQKLAAEYQDIMVKVYAKKFS